VEGDGGAGSHGTRFVFRELVWSFENFGTNAVRGKDMLSRAAMILKSRLRVICWMHSREGTRDFAALLREFLRY
jgi:hypothetical protein